MLDLTEELEELLQTEEEPSVQYMCAHLLELIPPVLVLRDNETRERLQNKLDGLPVFESICLDYPDFLSAPLIQGDPDEDEDESGDVPLHYLCRRMSTPEFIQAVIHLCPLALGIFNSAGDSPLELLVARQGLPMATLEYLTRQKENHNAAFGATSEYGYTPLHSACVSGSMETCEYLAKQFPDAARQTTTTNQDTPLHKSTTRSIHGTYRVKFGSTQEEATK
jgi:ankyrin repeat protein